ncbi:MAG: AAA family ATPase [Solirubrobacteraceae bacterium]
MAQGGLELGHNSFAVRWRDFRAYEDTGWVSLKPLTLLLGANSAGKSSLIAPLLLLKQSLESRTGTNGLLTKGDLIDVGIFEDFVRDHDKSGSVELGVRWHAHARGQDLAPTGRYAPGGLVVAFGQGKDPQSVIVESFRVYDPYGRVMLSRTRRPDGNYTIQMVSPKNAGIGRPTATENVERRRAMRRAIRQARPADFMFLSRDVRQAGNAAQAGDDKPNFTTVIDDDRTRLYCSIVDYALWGLESILDGLHFVGPLREEPRRVYELSGETPAEVGTRGEYAPEIIYRWRKNRRRMREIQRWLLHFGFSDELEFTSVGTGGFSLSLMREGARAASTFVDTGVGLSQVLPLVVQGLVAESGEWLIIEQPEVHLNPRLQAALADLFASIAERGVNLVIESHSEHLLMRLRRLVAERRGDHPAVGLYFLEQSSGISHVREVPLEGDGRIDPEAWPREFFEDSLRESMRLAQAQAKNRKRRRREADADARQLRLDASDDARATP